MERRLAFHGMVLVALAAVWRWQRLTPRITYITYWLAVAESLV